MAKENEMQKKLSVTRLVGKMHASRLMKLPDNRMNCGRFIGIAYDKITGETKDYGSWTGLVGVFRGINPETGEIVNATQCFLPDIAQSLILVQLAQEGVRSVEFGFDIWAVIDEHSPCGFSYRAVSLTQENGDPLDRIQQKITGLLEAPQGGTPEGEGEGEGESEGEPARKAAGRRGGRR